MKDAIEKVKQFHVATGQPVLPRPGVPPHDRVRLRAALILEEALETVGAMLGIPPEQTKQFVAANNRAIQMELDPKSDIVEVADGIIDSIYVNIGAALEYGLGDNLEELFAEIHRSNLEKVSGGVRADGKIMKPEGWKKPDIGSILDFVA